MLFAQISPGELTNAHSDLEGISNCTKCHVLGEQVSKAKCLDCHSEITDLINSNRGYHSNKDVVGRDCWSCHGEHFGRNFQIIRFDKETFDHNKTNFVLKGTHKKTDCYLCHNKNLIVDEKLKKKNKTFLGLSNQCQGCHEDIHQGTLSNNCEKCHNEDKFKPAANFSHDNTRFRLAGSHQNVDCEKCHLKELRNNKPFQKFADVKFGSCKNCHNDVHKGKFGNDCQKCHNEISFHKVDIAQGFNHSKTNFPLIGKHYNVKCENCHKGSLNFKPKYSKCYNCHNDYHKGEFIKDNIQKDCSECHTEAGFSPSKFTIEKHSLSGFQLKFAHAAIPCISCHLVQSEWKFRISGDKCINCHENIHNKTISEKFFAEDKCENCHTIQSWHTIVFDHKLTSFALLGKHKQIACSECHFTYENGMMTAQKFTDLNSNCLSCHNDIHFGQFVKDGIELCTDCHNFTDWQPTLFDHSKTRFALDGAHKNLNCYLCHKTIERNGTNFIKFKIEDVSCKSCHS